MEEDYDENTGLGIYGNGQDRPDSELDAAPDLATIEARAAAATPGPWHVEPGSNFVYPPGTPESEQFFLLVDQYGDWLDFDGYWRGRADVDFISAARTEVPALVAYARALEAEIARLRAGLAELRRSHYSGIPAQTGGGGWILGACDALTSGRPCTCGADEHNARLDALLTAP